MRVLIVDDNLDAAESLEEVLIPQGHQVDIATGGPEALEAYRKHPYDVVFLDLKMPGMDGQETARRLLGLDPGVRIVVVTGNSVHEEHASVAAMGIAGLLRKPFRVEELLAYL